jgi:hypothetical protein
MMLVFKQKNLCFDAVQSTTYIAFLHNIETIRFVFRRSVLECSGRGRVESVRFVFAAPATADTALRCSSARESRRIVGI